MKITNSFIYRLFAVIFAFMLILPSGRYGFSVNAAQNSSDIKKQITALEKKLDEAKKKKEKIRSDIKKTEGQIKSLEAEIAEMDAEITAINNQLITIDALVEEWIIRSEEEKEKLSALQERQEEERARFDNMVRLSYKYGSYSYIELILGAESFGDFLQRLDMISYHLNYKQKILEALNNTEQELIESQKNFEESSKEINDYKIAKEQLSVELEDKMLVATKKKHEFLSTLGSQKTGEDLINEDIEALVKETTEKSKELKIVEAAELEARRNNPDKNKVTASSELAGTSDYIWPLPSNYTRISSSYGYRTHPVTGKKNTFHTGIDLPAPARTPIYAVASGTVVVSGVKGGYGNCVTINHGGGIITLYGHMSSINCSSGDIVLQGDVIGYVGTTGVSTGNHLHFTIYKDGAHQNPTNYIKP